MTMTTRPMTTRPGLKEVLFIRVSNLTADFVQRNWSFFGASIHVGLPCHVFAPSFAQDVAHALQEQRQYEFPVLPPTFKPSRYVGLSVSWWGGLQFGVETAVEKTTPLKEIPNVCSFPRRTTCFLPLDIQPGRLYGPVTKGTTPGEKRRPLLLEYASLPHLLLDLRRYALQYDLPTDRVGLERMRQQYSLTYLLSPDAEDEDGELRVYAEMMLAGMAATEMSLPLWFVT